jgi:hypothetical protein
MRTIEIKAYQFSELSEEAQERAIDKHREWDIVDGWYDVVFEDAKQCGEILGIEIKNIWFSGFSSQGDGACFDGEYSYAKRSCELIREYAPKDETLHRIADTLAGIQRRYFYSIYAYVKHSGHHYHSGYADIDVREDYYEFVLPVDDVKQVLREFMDWIYGKLREEYDYLTSDEAVKESLGCSEIEFTEDGERI